ncbi:MAG: hypothetical protein AVDCRST_MAG41-3208, partial [uncultured Corynebacteriales bacterium]
ARRPRHRAPEGARVRGVGPRLRCRGVPEADGVGAVHPAGVGGAAAGRPDRDHRRLGDRAEGLDPQVAGAGHPGPGRQADHVRAGVRGHGAVRGVLADHPDQRRGHRGRARGRLLHRHRDAAPDAGAGRRPRGHPQLHRDAPLAGAPGRGL